MEKAAKKARQPVISLAELEALKRKGFNQSQIAEMKGVTRQYISWVKRYYGGNLTPREQALEAWPWEVPAAMNMAAPCRRLRDHAEYWATGGKGMAEHKLRDLRGFYKRLHENDEVVEFDPEIPPQPGVSAPGGFAYRKREPEDGDLIIRVNEHTNLTEQGRRIWRFPPREP